MTARSEQDQNPVVNVNEAALQAALERKPEVKIAADFAVRVAARAVQLSPSRLSRVPHYARLTALVVAFLIAISLFALAPRTAASFGNIPFDLELVVLLQLSVLAWWLAKQANWSR